MHACNKHTHKYKLGHSIMSEKGSRENPFQPKSCQCVCTLAERVPTQTKSPAPLNSRVTSLGAVVLMTRLGSGGANKRSERADSMRRKATHMACPSNKTINLSPPCLSFLGPAVFFSVSFFLTQINARPQGSIVWSSNQELWLRSLPQHQQQLCTLFRQPLYVSLPIIHPRPLHSGHTGRWLSRFSQPPCPLHTNAAWTNYLKRLRLK